jgi:alpha-tubulin suppressor-like RCC1 family protein
MKSSSSPVQPANINLLPNELLLGITSEITDLPTLAALGLTSKTLANVVGDDLFWKNKFQEDYGLALAEVDVETFGNTWKEKYKFLYLAFLPSSVSLGEKHYAIVDDQRKLFIGGDNSFGQWGLGSRDYKKYSDLSTTSLFAQKIRSVSCGNIYSGVVTDNGEVYLFGGGLSHIFGRNFFIPKRINLSVKALKISCGPKDQTDNKASLGIILEDLSVYFFTVLDLKTIFNIPLFGPEPNLDTVYSNILPPHIKAIDISVGDSTFAIVSPDGKLYIWGYNLHEEKGYIGIRGENNQIIIEPVLIPLDEPIKQVSLDLGHIGVVSVNGNAYLWGDNTYGQIGNGLKISDPGYVSDVVIPFKLNIPGKVKSISCQGNTSSVVTTDGRLYVWGINNGNLINMNKIKNLPGVYTDQFQKFQRIALPIQLKLPSPVVAHVSNATFSLAIMADRMVNLWSDYS